MSKHNNKHGSNGGRGYKSFNGTPKSDNTAELIEALTKIAIWAYRRLSKKSKAAKYA